MGKELELLAPAGSFAILKGVIEAGADAVYIGGQQFGARAYAGNFSGEELLEALDFAHLRDRKVYLTVNTLLKNAELDRLYGYLLPLYEHGLDAVIVQDLGVLSLIRRWFGDLPVHASTQMTVTGTEGVRFLQKQGVSRVVLARELTLDEIWEIHEDTGMELEVFVHGALCYCYSGQCLFSSMLGGRSGNRGRCAQPCRLPYAVRDENGHFLRKDSYILSLKDLCAAELLPRLLRAGAYSLKIEGRMKQLPYAAGVVRAYRNFIDACLGDPDAFTVPEEEKKRLAAFGSRCGFTDAYLMKEYRAENAASGMITYEKPSFYSGDAEKEGAEEKEPEREYLPVSGRLTLKAGIPARLELTALKSPGQTAAVTGDCPQRADKCPLAEEDVRARMLKTKDTAFAFRELAVDLEENLFFPNGALNRLRRDGIAALEQALLEPFYRKAEAVLTGGLSGSGVESESNIDLKISGKTGNCSENRNSENRRNYAESGSTKKNLRLICAVEQRFQLNAVLSQSRVDAVYLSADAYSKERLIEELREDIVRCRRAQKEVYYLFPAVFRNRTAKKYAAFLEEFRALGLDGAVARNLETLHFAKERLPELRLIADHHLYAYNDEAVRFLQKSGVSGDTVPLELNRQEIRARDNAHSEMLVYGRYPLMVSAQCVRKNSASCRKESGFLWLKDRMKKEFPVRNCCGECYNIIYNSLPTQLFSFLEEFQAAGIRDFRLHFTVEQEEEIAAVCGLFEEFCSGRGNALSQAKKRESTNGHYKRGVE